MFDNFLRKIKLIQPIFLEVPISNDEFKGKLNRIVDESSFMLFEGFGSNSQHFVGKLNEEGFNIRPKKKFFSTSLSYLTNCKAKYEFTGNNKTVIRGEVFIAKHYPISLMVFIVIFYSLILSLSIAVWEDRSSLVGVIFYGLFMALIFYIVFRGAVNSGKAYFERELYFLANPTSI